MCAVKVLPAEVLGNHSRVTLIIQYHYASFRSLNSWAQLNLLVAAVNEEEIKIKYVLPWLSQAGISLGELQFERTFSVRIGRRSIQVNDSGDIASGRLDILVKRDGRNLLIVETKAGELTLTEGDRDQAISYARLVHPIAPYTVVTNGSDYHLYDTVTKERIKPHDIQLNGYEATLPESDIAEAQKLFLALSRENLLTFCGQQVAAELRLVKGTVEKEKKYVPELHVPRESVLKEVRDFYKSETPGLILVGQSGIGKTSEVCWLVEKLLSEGKPVLFFNGIELAGGIVEAISTEFAWTFNTTDLPAQVVRRMAAIAGCQHLTIIVDAIDEWTLERRENHLGALLRAAEGNNIKLLASCKASSVDSFITLRGIATSVDILSKRVEMEPFTRKEFHLAVEKYRKNYRFYGLFEDVVLEEARFNPFLLRVLFDVAKDGGTKHLTFGSSEFFSTYHERILKRTLNPRQADETLRAIAGLLYERNSNWLTETEIRSALRLGVNESLMEELFEFSILIRGENESGDAVIEFYFQQFRDYIIAFKARHFNTMTDMQLLDEFYSAMSPGVRGDVFILYYRLASTEHKHVLDCDVRKNAQSYLNAYRSLIGSHFPSIDHLFRPETSGRIGFIGEFLLLERRLATYGFRAIDESDDEVYFVPVQHFVNRDSNLSYLDGAGYMHSTGSSMHFRDGIEVMSEVVEHEILSQLDQLVKGGTLNESKCPELLVEFITANVLKNKDIFRSLFSDDGRSINYPIHLNAVLSCLRREKLRHHFDYEYRSEKVRRGKAHEEWDGGYVSVTYDWSPADDKWIDDAVEKAMRVDVDPESRVRYPDFEVLERSIRNTIEELRKTTDEIGGPLFAEEAGLRLLVDRGMETDLPVARAFIHALYQAFLRSYRQIIETNFPTLRQHFRSYTLFPLAIHIELGKRQFSLPPGHVRTSLDVYFSKARGNKSYVEVVEDLEEIRGDGDWRVRAGGTEFAPIQSCNSIFEHLFISAPGLAIKHSREMPLRSLVYKTISKELKDVEQAFRDLVGIPKYRKPSL